MVIFHLYVSLPEGKLTNQNQDLINQSERARIWNDSRISQTLGMGQVFWNPQTEWIEKSYSYAFRDLEFWPKIHFTTLLCPILFKVCAHPGHRKSNTSPVLGAYGKASFFVHTIISHFVMAFMHVFTWFLQHVVGKLCETTTAAATTTRAGTRTRASRRVLHSKRRLAP